MQEVISQSLIAQVSHFTMLKRLLDITHVCQFSRLFHRQRRTKPAVAIAMSIINAYKRRAVLIAQNANVAPTTVGVTYLRFMKMRNPTHVLRILTKDTFGMAEKPPYSQVIVPSKPNS